MVRTISPSRENSILLFMFFFLNLDNGVGLETLVTARSAITVMARVIFLMGHHIGL